MDNSIRKTPKEHCLPLEPLFDSLEGHQSYRHLLLVPKVCVSEIPTPFEGK